MVVGEFVESALVFGLVLGDAGVPGDQCIDRFGGSNDSGKK